MAAKPLPPVEYLRECFDYDPETGVLTWRVRPFSHFSGPTPCKIANTKFAKTEAGVIKPSTDLQFYRVVCVNYSNFKAHRIIWKLWTAKEPPEFIDHEDGNGLNNKISNLREATKAENCQNSKPRRKKYGNLKGVFFDKKSGKWIATIVRDGAVIYLGRFDTEKQGGEAYKTASLSQHGNFSFFSRKSFCR